MSGKRPRVFMMDLWATVPYYTAHLSKALLSEPIDLTVGSISYYLDPACFSSRGLKIDPGLLDVVGRFQLPRLLRRVLKLSEAMINLAALWLRFSLAPPDVIHVQFLPMLKWSVPLDVWFLEYCRKRGSKLVLTVHDLLPHDSGEQFKSIFLDLYARVDRLICHSDHIKARLEEEFSVPPEKIAVIPHGPFFYDVAAPVPASVQQLVATTQGPLVLWQGLIFPYKGVDLLLRAWSELESYCANCRLVVAGTGSPELLEQLRALAKQLGLQRVEFIFRFISTEELVSLYRAADIVVYPYKAITTSGALATGLALGKAMVASNLPVFREILTDHENALLFDPEDPRELARALRELVGNRELREQFAERVRAMRFGDESWKSIAYKTNAVYQAVLAVGR